MGACCKHEEEQDELPPGRSDRAIRSVFSGVRVLHGEGLLLEDEVVVREKKSETEVIYFRGVN